MPWMLRNAVVVGLYKVSFSLLPPRGKGLVPPAKRLAWLDTGGTHGETQGEDFAAPSDTATCDKTGGPQNEKWSANADQASAAAALRCQPSPGKRFRGRIAQLRQIPRSRHRQSHQRHGAGARDP